MPPPGAFIVRLNEASLTENGAGAVGALALTHFIFADAAPFLCMVVTNADC